MAGALTRGCGNVKCAVTLENSLAAPYTVKYILPIRSSLSTPRCLPREMKTYVRTYACGSFIHNCPKLKTTQMFINW